MRRSQHKKNLSRIPECSNESERESFHTGTGRTMHDRGSGAKKELTDGAKLEKLEWSGGTKKPRGNIECRASSSLLPRIGQRATASERATWLLVAVQLRAGAGRGLNNSRIIIYYVLKFSKPYQPSFCSQRRTMTDPWQPLDLPGELVSDYLAHSLETPTRHPMFLPPVMFVSFHGDASLCA